MLPSDALPRVCVDSLALAHGVRPGKRQAFLERAKASASHCGAELIWPVLVDGRLVADLEPEALNKLCCRSDFGKIGTAGFGLANVRSLTGGLTAAASLAAGDMLGADIVVTGGLGGIHRGRAYDHSADLHALATSRLPLICSGFKPFIDAAASVAALDAASVPILHADDGGWPCLYANDPSLHLGDKVDGIDEMAGALIAQQQLVPCCRSGLCVLSVPPVAALPLIDVEQSCAAAIQAANLAMVQGGALTPWLIKSMRRSLGEALDVANEAALMNNIVAASALAVKLAAANVH